MKQSIIIFMCFHLFLWGGAKLAFASDTIRYHRSSIYTMLINHSGYKYSNDISAQFLDIPLPDKYNDHNLNVRCLDFNKCRNQRPYIENFFKEYNIGKGLVSKWFHRDVNTGSFDMSLIKERGFYDANYSDIKLSENLMRGKSFLSDAGEDLIGRTFVVVNDISYVDKEQRANTWGAILQGLGNAANAWSQSQILYNNDYNSNSVKIGEAVSTLAYSGAIVANLIAGFKVKVKSYLYQICWNDSIAADFYKNYYFEKDNSNISKKSNYDNGNLTYNLKFIGEYKSKSGKTVLRGVHDNNELIRKVCARALDNNYSELAHRFEVFRANAPILSIDKDFVSCAIGLKEGVSSKLRYEVLEVQKDSDSMGTTKYKRVAKLKPVRDKIWDNRYMAVEEQANNSNNNFTVFKKISGGSVYPGMLVRETYSSVTDPNSHDAFIGGLAINKNQSSASLMYLHFKKVGFFIKGKTNFVSDLSYKYSYNYYNKGFWNGDVCTKRSSLTGGFMLRIFRGNMLYLGGGYGTRDVNWKTIQGNSVRMSNLSYKGVECETGIIFRVNKVLLSIGSSTNLNSNDNPNDSSGGMQFELNAGIGLIL